MHENRFIIREPLLGPKQQVLGYRLNWQSGGDSEGGPRLAEVAADAFQDADGNWLLGGLLIFLMATPASLADDAFQKLSPKNTVLRLTGTELSEPVMLNAVSRLRSAGFGISLRDAHAAIGDRSLLSSLSHIEVRFSAGDIAVHAKLYASLKPLATRIIAKEISSWEDYDACASLGLDAFVGKLHLTPRPAAVPQGLNASQTAILQMMQMVQQNADVRDLEAILKRDPSISYKLLRFINSAGFGQRVEVQSLRHAVSLLGYGPLYRWLSLLLATAGTYPYSPVLLQTAIIRGRFAELLGAQYLSKAEGENLFVAGMFSLLDRLTGLSMDALLDKILLTDEIRQALVRRQGIFGPYLALVEACELNTNLAESLAASLRIDAAEVNKAHLESVVWSNHLLSQ
jgi:c-di-GMP-related signal transduction protein